MTWGGRTDGAGTAPCTAPVISSRKRCEQASGLCHAVKLDGSRTLDGTQSVVGTPGTSMGRGIKIRKNPWKEPSDLGQFVYLLCFVSSAVLRLGTLAFYTIRETL